MLMKTFIVRVVGICILATAQPSYAMVRHVAFFSPPVPLEEFDRWYFNTHSMECIRYYGAWLRRYETYRAQSVPEEADRFHVYRGRYTELWYDSADAFREAAPNDRAYTPARWGAGISTAEQPTVRLLVPAMPTEDFLRKSPLPSRGPFLRMLIAVKYPAGVSQADGEKWYLNVHAQEEKKLPALVRYVSYHVVPNSPLASPWVRLTELWFKSYADWKAAMLQTSVAYTAPPWAQAGREWLDTASTFVSELPDRDFLAASANR